MKTVLVIEDEPTLVATLRYNLERDGYRVLTALDGAAGLALARSERPDVLLLDLMLPVMSGLEVCRVLRKESTVPILMLTARTEETDRVVGLELGADDYVSKPFSMRELLARVRALVRRSELRQAEASDMETLGDITVDVRSRRVTRSDRELALRPKEYELLLYFLRNRGRAFTREQLLDQVWGYGFVGDTRTVDVHVRWLRQKVEETPSKPVHVITIRGVGYRFEG